MDPSPTSSSSPWLRVWTSPRATIRRILDNDPSRGLLALSFLLGFTHVLANARLQHLGEYQLLEQLLLFSAIMAPLVGWILISFFGWVFFKIGARMKGEGSGKGLRAAVAWASLPLGGLSLFWCLMIAKFGNRLFQRNTLLVSEEARYLYAFYAIAAAALVWSAILLVHTVAEAHRFSTARAAQCVVSGVAAVLIPAFLLALVLALIPMGSSGPPSHPLVPSVQSAVSPGP